MKLTSPTSRPIGERPTRKLDNDGLADTTFAMRRMEIRDKVPVLVVDGEGKRREENQDTFFIRTPLSPCRGPATNRQRRRAGRRLATKVLERAIPAISSIFIAQRRELTDRQWPTWKNTGRRRGVAFFLAPRSSPITTTRALQRRQRHLPGAAQDPSFRRQ